MKTLDDIFSTTMIREQTQKLYQLTLEGKTHFELDESRIEIAAQKVIEEIEQRYPKLDIPLHARSNHFKAGGIDRLEFLRKKIRTFQSDERARVFFDLIIPSVLLDAGAGEQWKFYEEESSQYFERSEGIAVASYYLFTLGELSRDRIDPFRVDGKVLQNFSLEDLKQNFQYREDNKIVAIEGRCHLLQQLGTAIMQNSEWFPNQRLGGFFDALVKKHGQSIQAGDLLRAVIDALGSIWPGRLEREGLNLGDVWWHPLLGEESSLESLVPFHKLSQWLSYSLVEALAEGGVQVTHLEQMTGLPEYRNGGLFLDTEVIKLKDSSQLDKIHEVGSPLVIEWRALTVQLLERVAAQVAEAKPQWQLNLSQVLEGGTWWAGRKLAAEKRKGAPPLKLNLEGTVF